ncbi:MAG: hypothetical protein HWN81_17130 [Candidatus Lokiarchaeota archaeon]|nr:hypothetical protein [Candidatus Lokiarchaeota archaeon]
MVEIQFIVQITIGYIFILCISVYTLLYIFTHHEKYGIKFTAILNFLTIFNACIIYSTLYFISVIYFFTESINILLWKLSLIFGFIGLMLSSLIYVFLKEFKKIPYFPFLFFMILFGLLIGSFYMPNSVQFSTKYSNLPPFILNSSKINYTFNFMTGLIISIFQSSFVIYFFFLSYIIYKKARNKAVLTGIIINTIIFLFPILMYILYIVFQAWIFRELHIFSLWINITSLCYILVRKPEIFSELTNKIYYINIYHKSGILLFSYKFKTSNNEVDSTIWGSILIGINHILSEFVYTKDQIEVLQTDNSDIIVNYDDFGFAVVLITNRKNPILKKLMDNFSKDFRDKFKNELTEIQDLNKLINVSEFKETKDIIENNFHMYL